MGLRVALEVAPKRAFASALDWPGWSRGGKTEEAALETLLAYAPRYAAVAQRARITFHPPATLRGLEGVELMKGPRGGGRTLNMILGHVREAEVAYLGKLGARATEASMTAVHDAFADAVTARATGSPVANPNKARTFWVPRYAVRRAAWHVLDHAWEIEDRSA